MPPITTPTRYETMSHNDIMAVVAKRKMKTEMDKPAHDLSSVGERSVSAAGEFNKKRLWKQSLDSSQQPRVLVSRFYGEIKNPYSRRPQVQMLQV